MRGVRSAIIYQGDPYRGAAEELAAYIERMAGARPEITAGPDAPASAREAFVVGPPAANALAATLDKQVQGAISAAVSPPQAIVVWPLARSDTRYVVIAGNDAATTRWAVYAYLEVFCHAGFFQDGEYVPKLRPPATGEPLVTAPRFLDRRAPMAVGGGHWGLKKFYARFWTLDEIKRELRWMSKRRMNVEIVQLGVTAGLVDGLIREVCEEIGYPLGPATQEVLDVSGFPVTWSWPPDMRTAMTREAIAYGRELGIRFCYGLSPGQVPPEFKRKYPERKYVEAERWTHAEIHPDDPLYEQYAKAYVRKLIEVFGTDHIYVAAPYGETSPESTPEANFELKKKAALHFLRLLKEVDRQAVWSSDSWDFFWSRETWTPEHVKAYLDAVPAGDFYINDTNADQRGIPVHREHGYFHGKNWSFGVMHSAAGHDQIHGDFAHVLSGLRHVATDPEASRCRGVWLVPELTHYNMLYYDFLTRAAWDPATLELDAFFSDHALRRYGRRSARRMRRAIGEVVAALYTRELNVPVYNLATLKWIWQNAAPWIHAHTIPRLHRAVRIMLNEHKHQEANPLYDNDVLSVTKAYLAEVAGFHFHEANAMYAVGDAPRLEQAAARCVAAMEWVARILSTRPDYSLAQMIVDVMTVPGVNPNTARMILRGVVNWDYCSNDSYEQVANYDLPRMAHYFDLLRQRLGAGRPPIDLWKEVEGVSPTHEQWVNGEATLKRTIAFDGTTLDAAAQGFEQCSTGVPGDVREGRPLHPGRTVAWREDFSSPSHWEVGEKGARVDDNVVSSDPVYGPTGWRMHKEWVDMPMWGTVRTTTAAGLSAVDLRKAPLLTIEYRIEAGEDPVHLWANWKGASDNERRTRVWRSFAPRGEWTTDTVNLLAALRSQTEEPQQLLSLEIGTLRPPHEVRFRRLELSG